MDQWVEMFCKYSNKYYVSTDVPPGDGNWSPDDSYTFRESLGVGRLAVKVVLLG